MAPRFRLGLAIGLAAGYVLGTKAGRERYLQMQRNVRRAGRAWNRIASSKVAKGVAHKAGDALGGSLEKSKTATLSRLPWMKDRMADRESVNHLRDGAPASSF